jgi:hypothetical protein
MQYVDIHFENYFIITWTKKNLPFISLRDVVGRFGASEQIFTFMKFYISLSHIQVKVNLKLS